MRYDEHESSADSGSFDFLKAKFLLLFVPELGKCICPLRAMSSAVDPYRIRNGATTRTSVKG